MDQSRKQELFNKVATHLVKQGSRAFDETHEVCRYRAADGKTCAVGALIPKHAYDKRIENRSINSAWGSLRRDREYDGGFMAEDHPHRILFTVLERSGIHIADDAEVQFLIKLQNLHDDCFNWSQYGLTRQALTEFASSHKVEIPEGLVNP